MTEQRHVVLNLEEHDPEEFEGKIIQANGAQYVVGPFAGSGADRIVHSLINTKSALCNHAVKVIRDLEKTRQGMARTASPFKLASLFHNLLLYSIPVEIPGGEVELQPVFTNVAESLPRHPASDDIERAETLVGEARIKEALSVYEMVLARYPDHSDALVLSGRLLANIGDLAECMQRMDRAIRVEPHIENYHLAIIRYASAARLHPQVIWLHERMRTVFPYQCDVDILRLDAHLALADPEGVVRQLEQSWLLETEEKAGILKRLEDAINRRHQACEALKCGIEQSTTEGPIKIPAVKFVEEAFFIFPEDPSLAANLGILLMRAGDSVRAKELLIEASRKLRFPINTVCVVNAAFCDIDAGNFAEAMPLLERASHALANHAGSSAAVSWPDVPGRAAWIFETEQGLGYIEDRPEVALAITDRAIAETGGMGSVPEAVHDYRRWLAIATESMNNRT